MTTLAWPRDPLAAVTHPHPYPYYDDLARRPPFRDEALGIWVVASLDAVRSVTDDPVARVRPPGASVPPHLVDRAAGETFGRLVRMNDGHVHRCTRAGVDRAFASLTPDTTQQACRLATDDNPDDDVPGLVEYWMTSYPTAVVARLIGVDASGLGILVEAARALAAVFAPGAGPALTDAADRAADTLGSLVSFAARRDEPNMASALAAAIVGNCADDAVANAVGLFFQTFDATAGLIGNTLVLLAGSEIPEPARLPEIVERVLADDPPVHNTRRFFHADGTIGSANVRCGEMALLVLAAANRDPRASQLTFGSGAHRCPASALAPTIASQAVTA